MGLIPPGGQNLQDFLELWQVLSTYDGDLRDLLWWPQERAEELLGRAAIPRVAQISQSIQQEPVFSALPRLSRRESTHTTVARRTALWESLVGKPRGKALRESHRSLDPLDGMRDTAVTAQEESARDAPTRDYD